MEKKYIFLFNIRGIEVVIDVLLSKRSSEEILSCGIQNENRYIVIYMVSKTLKNRGLPATSGPRVYGLK